MKKFKKLYVEITNSCNMSCSFCPGTLRPEGFMGRELFEKIMKETQNRALYTYLHVMGEPLMHPDISDFMDIAAKYGHRVSITTNGTLVSRLEYLLDKPALRSVNFSLHSAEGADNAEYLEKIFAFTYNAAKTGRVSVSFRLWNGGGDISGNEMLVSAIERAFCPGVKIAAVNTAVNGFRISERIFVNIADKFRWPSMTDPEIPGPAYCKGMREQAAILCDGTVTACCLDKEGIISLGNIENENFDDIIKSPRAQAVSSGFGRRECAETLCKKCSYRMRFNSK